MRIGASKPALGSAASRRTAKSFRNTIITWFPGIVTPRAVAPRWALA
jgi:hypothetical protein